MAKSKIRIRISPGGIVWGIVIIIFFYLIPVQLNFSPQSGVKIGQIISVHQTGLIIKSNDIIIMKGGLQNGSGVVGGQHNFNISDDQVPFFTKLMEQQKELSIEYNCPLIYNSWTYPTGCKIVSIK